MAPDPKLSCLLTTGAQFTKTLRTLTDDGLPDPGQDLRVSLDLDQRRYDRAQAETFYLQLLERVELLPAVRSAALSDKDVLRGLVGSSPVRVRVPGEGPDSLRGVVTMYAAGEFFDTIGLPILQGRQFAAGDTAGVRGRFGSGRTCSLVAFEQQLQGGCRT